MATTAIHPGEHLAEELQALGMSAALRAYAARAGKSADEYLHQVDYSLLTPETAGSAIVGLVRMPVEAVASAYVLIGTGLPNVPSP